MKTGKRVAVIGSGPAGMACAQQLARAGHDVHLYEKNAKAGGLLRYGIPDFKMEKAIIDRRVTQMEAEGVTFHYGVHVGVSEPASALLDEYDAIVLTGGAEKGARPADRRPRPARRPFRHGLPAAAEPPRLRRAAERRRADPRRRQIRGGDRRRRHRLRLHRHGLPPGRGHGHAA